MAASRAGTALERAGGFFEAVLWDSPGGRSARERLERHGLETETLREFGVGYAPGDTRILFEHLRAAGHSVDELLAAGLVTPSER